MKNFIEEFKAYKIIYILIIMGFSLFIISTTMVYSIYKVCEDNSAVKNSGSFNNVYSLRLKNIENVSFSDIYKLSKEILNNCSVITADDGEGTNQERIIGIVNYSRWVPPLITTFDSPEIKDNSIILGRGLFHDKKEIELDSKSYNVGAIAGLNDYFFSVYDNKIYVPLNILPKNMELALRKNNEINLVVRSNKYIRGELKSFEKEIKKIDPSVGISFKRLNWEYFKSSVSNGGAREAFSFPLRVCLISMLNGLIILYFFNHIQRRKIALEKALGGSNIHVILSIFVKLGLCIIPSITIASFLILLLIRLNFKAVGMDIVFGVPNIVLGSVSTLILCVLTALASFIYVLKVQPAKMLNQ
jgi:hypothetical protein